MEDITAIQGGKLGKGLKKFLTDEIVDKGKGKESLVVVDPHLGSYIASPPEGYISFRKTTPHRSLYLKKTEYKCQRDG